MPDWKDGSYLLTPDILERLFAASRRARKTGGIWTVDMSKALELVAAGAKIPGTVRNDLGIFTEIPAALSPRRLLTLEGEYVPDATQVLCKGAIGELWQQKPEKIARAYIRNDIRDGFWTWHMPVDENILVDWVVVQGYGTWRVPCPWSPSECLFGREGDVLVFKDGTKDCYPVAIQVFVYTYKPL